MLGRLAKLLALLGEPSFESVFRLMHQAFVHRILLSFLASCVAGNEHGFNVVVEFVEEDIRKDGRNHRTLRDSAERPIELPILQIPGIKQLLDESNETSIMD